MLRSLLPLLSIALIAGACESSGFSDEPLTVETRSALEILPPDAQVVASVNLRQIADNPELSLESMLNSLGEMHEEARARVSEFVATTGFDPAKDLRSVYVSSSLELNPVVLAYGAYDVERLSEFIDSRQSSIISKYFYRDVPVYEMAVENNDSMLLALAGESMMIASPNKTELHAVLDRALDTENREIPQRLSTLAGQVAGSDSWIVITELPVPADTSEKPDMTAIASSILSASAGMNAAADKLEMTSWLTPQQDLSAEDLEDLVRGGIAALKIEAKDNPTAFDILDRIETRTTSGTVQIRAELTTEQLRAFRKDRI